MKRYMAWGLSLIFYVSLLPWNMAWAVDYWKYNASDINFEDYGLMDNTYKLSSPYVDVRAFGTITFGSSPSTAQKTANAAAIQAAYDYLVATYGGGRLVFPAQKIIINTAINISASYVTFEGQKGGYLLKGSEISGEGATPSTLFTFSANATDKVKFKDIILSNAPIGITIPDAIYTSNFYLQDVGFIAITDKAINVADNTDYLTGGIVGGTFTRVNFYSTKYGFYSNDRAMVNNLLFDDCYWGNPIDNGIGIRAGDGTYFTVRGGLNNGTPTTRHIPISIGYGYAKIDGLEFSDFGNTPGTNDNVPLIEYRASKDVSLTKNIGLEIRNSTTLVNYRGPIIGIEAGADTSYIGIFSSSIDSVSGHTAATDNQVITNASVIDHLTVRDSKYNGGALQEDSPDVTWSGNWGGYQQFWPANVQRHWSGTALVVNQGGGNLSGADFGKIFVDTTGASNFTYNLPDANTGPKGSRVSFKKDDAGTGSVTINRVGADTIDGLTVLYNRRAGELVTLITDGASKWYREYDFFRGGTTASVADGGTISHGFGYAPSAVVLTGTVAGEIVTYSAISSTTITVDIKKHDGSAGTSQSVSWMAK